MDDDVGTFGWQDYLVFSAMLLLSAAIGIYYAYKDRKGKEGVQGYLLASRQMNFLPVSVSISLSFVSAVTILGVPAEIYYFGSMYIWFLVSVLWICPVVTEIFIPIFYRLGVTSAFEYLEMRFNRTVRLLSTLMFILQNIMYIGIMIYAPALALSSVTDFNLWVAVATIGIVCTFYTTLGGLKAVIWTDVFQGGVLLIGMIVTLIVSVNSVGGFSKVWEACERGGRLEFNNFSFDPRERTTFWSMSVGLGFLWLSVFGTNQSQVQRYLSCKTETEAKKGLLMGFLVAIVCFIIIMLAGFSAYAYFEGCDPFVSKQITAQDQLLPLMVLKIFKSQPGLPGLFVAGLFAGCLSTVSSGINALACVAVKDFIQPFLKRSPRIMTIISKAMVFVFGALCIGFAILASVLGNVLQASLTALGLVGGPLLGIFSLGITFPCATSWGAGIGLAVGFALPTWIYIGTYVYPTPTEFLGLKPLSVSNCTVTASNATTADLTTIIDSSTESLLVTTIQPAAAERPAIADLYAVSYAYYTAIGFGASLIVGLIVSFITCGYKNRKNVDPKLVIPIFDHVLFSWLPLSFRKWMWCGLPREDIVSKNQVCTVSYTHKDDDQIEETLKEEVDISLDHPPKYSESDSRVRGGVDKQDERNYDNEAFTIIDEL